MSNISISDTELLKFAIENGMLDAVLVQEKIEMQKREELLSKHPYKIWEGKNGKWYTYLPENDGRRLIKRKTQESILDVVVKYWKTKEENPTLQEAFDMYNDSRLKVKQISEASHLRYSQDFNRFFEPWKKRRIKSITADELCDFIENRVVELNLTSKAFSNFKTITSGLFKRAYRKKWVEFRVEEEVLEVIDLSEKRFHKVQKADYQEVFSEEEYQDYVQYLSDNPDIWNLALLLILVTGLRGGEIVALSYEDIESKGDFFVVKVHHTETRYKDVDGKYVYEIKDAPKSEAGIRQAVVPKQFNWIYRDLLKNRTDNSFIFVNPKHGNRFTTNSLRRRQERNCKKLKFYQKSPHKGRKTYGSILLDNNLDNNMILQQMGHADISTTENHYHRNMKPIEKKAEILSEIHIFNSKIS